MEEREEINGFLPFFERDSPCRPNFENPRVVILFLMITPQCVIFVMEYLERFPYSA